MNLMEGFFLALEGIWSNKLRSFLTMLGITIGIAAVITVVAVGEGGRAVLMQEMEKIGSNLFAVYIPWNSSQMPRENELTLEDVTAIKELVPAVKYLAPSSFNQANISSGRKEKAVTVQGTTADYGPLRNVEILHGRFLTSADVAAARPAVVIDEKLAAELFRSGDAVGQKVLLKGTSAVIVGVAKAESSFLTGGDQTSTVYIPITYWQQLFPRRPINQLEGQAASKDQVDPAMKLVARILERRHNAAPGRYQTMSMEQQMAVANRVTGILTLIIGAIAAISLFVGGIGVMNIMLVSVTERTREIGIRMALGARRRDIMGQFLVEALTISLMGGVLGMLIGAGGAFAIAHFAHWPPLISWSTVAIAFAFSTAVGLFFGLYPANKAARLDPIEALRYE
ncbi:putative ABC transporter permease YknZ [Moorella thermoacetica]|uniref:ABC transporter permease n=1 Tax=Neomoorella thermoacetica TaxID=1525 RepID=UPI0030CDEF1D